MSGSQFKFRKGQFAKWLLTVTIVFSLFELSETASVSSLQYQPAATEKVHLRSNNSPNKSIVYYCQVPRAAANSYNSSAANKDLISLCNVLVNIRFNYLAWQFANVRQIVQMPCIACIFYHSGNLRS